MITVLFDSVLRTKKKESVYRFGRLPTWTRQQTMN